MSSVLDDFDIFCSAAADAMDNAGNERLAFLVPLTRDSLKIAGFMGAEQANARARELIQSFYLRRFGAVATRCSWSPDEGPSSEAWALVCLEILKPGRIFVRRLEEDEKWWEIPLSEMPWFLGTTAGGLRALLEKGEWNEIKEGQDERLFGRIAEGNPPPPDEQGRL